MITRTTNVVLGGRGFLEAPHWFEGEVWCSDLHRREVIAVSAAGRERVVAAFEDQPSGLGFLPDGSAIVVALLDRRILRVADRTVHADLAALTKGGTNDMTVDARGRAYVGSFGYDLFARAPQAPGNLVLVDEDGDCRVVADDLAFPNGMVLTDTGTLIVAESHADRLTEFDVGDDGSLSGRRVWAGLPGGPDGLTIDVEGLVWVALPRDGSVVRVRRGGEIVETVRVSDGWRAISCGFGDDDLRTLYVTSALYGDPHTAAALECVRVDTPGGRGT